MNMCNLINIVSLKTLLWPSTRHLYIMIIYPLTIVTFKLTLTRKLEINDVIYCETSVSFGMILEKDGIGYITTKQYD